MLSNKIALVTGASRGIGRQIAITLAQYGATVILNYASSDTEVNETIKLIESMGKEAVSYKCNVADFQASKEMIEFVLEKYGRIDILVNNAGITRDNLLMKMSEDDFDKVIDINLKGCFNSMKHVNRQMLKQKSGRIINISSVVGINGNAGQLNYSASKAGIIGMTKSLAKELASRGITVNAIAPGFIKTDMTDVLTDTVKESILDKIPLRTFGETDDIAETVAFLASDKARYITGQVISVDGGMSM